MTEQTPAHIAETRAVTVLSAKTLMAAFQKVEDGWPHCPFYLLHPKDYEFGKERGWITDSGRIDFQKLADDYAAARSDGSPDA